VVSRAAGRRSSGVIMGFDAVALLLPGGSTTVQAPLLAYPALAMARRGVEVRPIAWQRPAWESDDQMISWVRGESAGLLADSRALLVGKSLGSFAAELAAERALPAVWLTPLLRFPRVVAAIGAATVPPLLVGGGADELWDGAAARRLSPYVLEIPDADHALYVPGRASASVAVLGRVVDAMEEYLDREVWPAG
jgi:hypothetical protein